MNIQIFGSSKCFDTKKAERWFKERRIKYQYIDLFKKGFSPGEYRSVRAKLSYEELVNTKCRAYQDLYMAYITRDAAEEKLFDNPQLLLWATTRKSGQHGNKPQRGQPPPLSVM